MSLVNHTMSVIFLYNFSKHTEIRAFKKAVTGQGLLYTWTDSLGTFFATFVIIKISVNDTNTICRSSKSITFPKIWRVWLKN